MGERTLRSASFRFRSVLLFIIFSFHLFFLFLFLFHSLSLSVLRFTRKMKLPCDAFLPVSIYIYEIFIGCSVVDLCVIKRLDFALLTIQSVDFQLSGTSVFLTHPNLFQLVYWTDRSLRLSEWVVICCLYLLRNKHIAFNEICGNFDVIFFIYFYFFRKLKYLCLLCVVLLSMAWCYSAALHWKQSAYYHKSPNKLMNRLSQTEPRIETKSDVWVCMFNCGKMPTMRSKATLHFHSSCAQVVFYPLKWNWFCGCLKFYRKFSYPQTECFSCFSFICIHLNLSQYHMQ